MSIYNYGYGSRPLEADNYRTTVVATPLVTLAELKRHLGIFEDDFDTQLSEIIIPAAEQVVSNITGEFQNDTVVQANYLRFSNTLVLPHRFVDSIESVQYYDTADLLTTLPGADYIFDTTSRFPQIQIFGDIPEVSSRFGFPVQVSYLAAIDSTRYGQQAIIHAIMMVASDLWYNRTNTADSRMSAARLTAERILAPLRRVSV